MHERAGKGRKGQERAGKGTAGLTHSFHPFSERRRPDEGRVRDEKAEGRAGEVAGDIQWR